jgi:hypothetical protein
MNTALNGNAAHFPHIFYDCIAQQQDETTDKCPVMSDQSLHVRGTFKKFPELHAGI